MSEEETENIYLNGIKWVEIERIDMNKSWDACCCKSWMIIYKIFTINFKNKKKETEDPKEYWQLNRNEDKSEIIKKQKKKKIYIKNMIIPCIH